MDDRTIKLALLGDKAAQERMTERGELLPCAHCRGKMAISYDDEGIEGFMGRKWAWIAVCSKCCASTGLCYSKEQAIAANNTRSPILTQEELEGLK